MHRTRDRHHASVPEHMPPYTAPLYLARRSARYHRPRLLTVLASTRIAPATHPGSSHHPFLPTGSTSPDLGQTASRARAFGGKPPRGSLVAGSLRRANLCAHAGRKPRASTLLAFLFGTRSCRIWRVRVRGRSMTSSDGAIADPAMAYTAARTTSQSALDISLQHGL